MNLISFIIIFLLKEKPKKKTEACVVNAECTYMKIVYVRDDY